jgi:hypothetical protein
MVPMSSWLESFICQNPALLDIGEEESRFLTVLTNFIELVHPHSQSVWIICEAAGEFMRELDGRKQLECVYELITQGHPNTDEEKTEEEEAKAESMAEDEKTENEGTGDEGTDEENPNGRDRKRKLIDTIIVCIRKIRSREY